MATKTPTAAQMAARQRFAEMARAGVFTRKTKRASNPAARAYSGKYPHRVKQVSSAKGQTWVIANDGERLILDSRLAAAGTGGRMPRLGDDIRDYRAYVVADNPSPRKLRQTQGNHNGVFTVIDWQPSRNTSSGNPVFAFTLRDSHGTHYHGKTKGNAGFVYGLPRYMSEGQKIDAKLSVSPTGVVTMIDGDLIKSNPAKRAPAKRKPINRPSQATGSAPSKRLVKRRKATAKAPPGFFANPKAREFGVYLKASNGVLKPYAKFTDKKKAVEYAQAKADQSGYSFVVKAI